MRISDLFASIAENQLYICGSTKHTYFTSGQWRHLSLSRARIRLSMQTIAIMSSRLIRTMDARVSADTVYLPYARITADGMIMAAGNLRSQEKIIADGAFVRRLSRSIGVTQKQLGSRKIACRQSNQMRHFRSLIIAPSHGETCNKDIEKFSQLLFIICLMHIYLFYEIWRIDEYNSHIKINYSVNYISVLRTEARKWSFRA